MTVTMNSTTSASESMRSTASCAPAHASVDREDRVSDEQAGLKGNEWSSGADTTTPLSQSERLVEHDADAALGHEQKLSPWPVAA